MNEGKSINEARESAFTDAAGVEIAKAGESRGMDMKRRRLIRGSAVVAPMVLTLRSGTVGAIASGCVKVIDQGTTGAGGEVPGQGPGIAGPGNACIKSPGAGICPPDGQQPYIQQGTYAGSVSADAPFKCLNASGEPIANTNVAIVSATAVPSLIPV